MPATKDGERQVDWFSLPSNDHPVIPQNVYRMSGGADNTQQFEQIGQSFGGKHAFGAGKICQTRAAFTDAIRCKRQSSWLRLLRRIRPQFKRASKPPLARAPGSIHSPEISRQVAQLTITPATFMTCYVSSGEILVDVDDLNTSLNPGATYFAEAQYIVARTNTHGAKVASGPVQHV